MATTAGPSIPSISARTFPHTKKGIKEYPSATRHAEQNPYVWSGLRLAIWLYKTGLPLSIQVGHDDF